MRKFASTMCAAAVVLGGSTAFAQEFGSKGDVAFSAERLFSIHGTRTTEEFPVAGDFSADHTGIGFGWQGQELPSPYEVPRFAFDFFVIDGLSIGGSIGYASMNFEIEDGGDADTSFFILSPRIGYAHMFSRVFGIWPRGGFTYHSIGAENNDWNGFGLTLECMFPISPAPHFAFEIGPTFDLDFAGEHDPDAGPDRDFRQRSFGVRFGLFGWL